MKNYQPADIRNFAIVGHASSGKTMLSEAMLAVRRRHQPHGPHRRRLHRVGLSRERKEPADFRLGVRCMHTEWAGKKFNIIDTPGYLDFISEGLGALRVGDFALVVIHAQHGLGVGTDRVWNYATELRHPENDRRQRARQGERGFRRGAEGSAGAFRAARLSR